MPNVEATTVEDRHGLIALVVAVVVIGLCGIASLVHNYGFSGGGPSVKSDVQEYWQGRVSECHNLHEQITDNFTGRRVDVYGCSVGDGYGGYVSKCFTDVDGDVEPVTGGRCDE